MWPLVVLSHIYIFLTFSMLRQQIYTCKLVQSGLK